jgi:hypothetical protein
MNNTLRDFYSSSLLHCSKALAAFLSLAHHDLAWAGLHLCGVIVCHGGGATRVILDRGIVAPRAARVAAMARIVGQVQVVGVMARDTERGRRLVVIPADEIGGIGEARAPRAVASGLALILEPGAVQRLRISVDLRFHGMKPMS